MLAEDTRAPIAGALVSLAGTSTETRFGPGGQFALSAVAAGSQTVFVSHDGYAPLSQPITVPRKTDATRTITSRAGSPLTDC